MRTLVLTLGLLGVALTSGCSSTHTAQLSAKKVTVDKEYVAAVEAASRGTGTKIIWVNPPTEVVTQKSAIKTGH